MNYFDILLAKKLENDKDVSIVQLNVSENGTYSESGKAYSPVVVDVQPPPNSYLKTPIDSYPATAQQLPIPKCDVEIANQKSCKVFVSNKPFVNDKVPYLFRRSAGGDRVYEKLIGGTIAWNQLVNPPASGSSTQAGITYTYDGNGRTTCSGTLTDIWSYGEVTQTNFTFVKSHKYFLRGCPTSGSEAHLRVWVNSESAFPFGHRLFDDGKGKINEALADETNVSSNIMIRSTYTGDITKLVFIPQLYDLTQMFGTTIADYIYSLEQSTAGAGVAYFRQMFPNDYYAYDSGTLQSVNVASKKVYDSNNTLVATYAFDSDLTLRGIPKLDANNNLYYDGDVYESDGTVTRRYGVVDLGSLNWLPNSAQTGRFDSDSLASLKVVGEANILCALYTTTTSSQMPSQNMVIRGSTVNGNIVIVNTAFAGYTNTQVQNALSGVYLVYELATPTTESADPYINPQIVDADGTEEFVDYAYSQSTRDVAVPVGHDSLYYNGQAYQTNFEQATTETINMAELHSIVPPSGEFYMASNGILSVDVWKK